jgi:hypothetical protein
MLLSLESRLSSAPSSFPARGPREPPVNGQGGLGRPGSENMSEREWGFPRNLGDPVVSTKKSRAGVPGDQPQARHRHTQQRRERKMRVPWYRPCEGNETRREGRQEVGVPR